MALYLFLSQRQHTFPVHLWPCQMQVIQKFRVNLCMEGMSVRNHFKFWLVNRSIKRSSWIVARKFVQQLTYNHLQLQDGARAREEKKCCFKDSLHWLAFEIIISRVKSRSLLLGILFLTFISRRQDIPHFLQRQR